MRTPRVLIVWYILGIAGVILGAFFSLGLLVLGWASAPNSTGRDELRIRLFIWSAFLGGVACLAGGIALLILGRPGWALASGFLPVLAMLGTFIAADIARRR